MVRMCGTRAEQSRRMLKKATFSPSQPWRAKTRLIPGKVAAPRLILVSRLTFHGSRGRCENAAGGLFQHPAERALDQAVAEREGFEPSVEVLPLRRFSKPLPSATRPPLHWSQLYAGFPIICCDAGR